ncbi:MAG: hypothetical protein ACTSPQ_06315 [Candidatus Helarchaeota archaeon]
MSGLKFRERVNGGEGDKGSVELGKSYEEVKLREILKSLMRRSILLLAIFGLFSQLDSGLFEYTLEGFLYKQWGATISDV